MVILHSDFDMKITSYPTSYAWCKYNLKFPHICFSTFAPSSGQVRVAAASGLCRQVVALD